MLAINVDPLGFLIAAPHSPTRAAIRTALEAAGFGVTAECVDIGDAMAAVVRTRPAVCVLDLDIADDPLAAVTALSAETKVVVLASWPDERTFFAVLRAGATGYLLKNVRPARLVEELAGVALGAAAVDPMLVARLADAFASPPALSSDGLTKREWQTLQLLADGLTTKEIALRLGVAPTTVRRHLSSATKRLGVRDRRAAVDLLRRLPRQPRSARG